MTTQNFSKGTFVIDTVYNRTGIIYKVDAHCKATPQWLSIQKNVGAAKEGDQWAHVMCHKGGSYYTSVSNLKEIEPFDIQHHCLEDHFPNGVNF